MLKKEKVFVRVSSEKKARKLKKLLEMFGESFGECTFSHLENDVGFVYFESRVDKWYIDVIGKIINKTKVSLKQLRNILAVDKLREGDVVVLGYCKSKEYIGVFDNYRKGYFEVSKYISLNSGSGNLMNNPGSISNFIRYATEEEKALLEPKKELEVGKWYFIENKNCQTRKTDALVFIKEFKGNDNTNYGFDSKGDWTNQFWADDLKNMGRIVEATPQEVEEALIKEAKRRYKVGDKLSEVYDDFSEGNRIFNLNLRHQVGLCDLWIDDVNGYLSCIFKNGKWAEVIEPELTLEERVKELEEKVRDLE